VRLERGQVVVETFQDRYAIVRGTLDLDSARWVQAVALPTVLAHLGKVPSDRPAKVGNGQIPGQITVEEAIAAGG